MTTVQRQEYEAWQSVCEELRDCGVDINREDQLAKYINNWGFNRYLLLKENEIL